MFSALSSMMVYIILSTRNRKEHAPIVLLLLAIEGWLLTCFTTLVGDLCHLAFSPSILCTLFSSYSLHTLLFLLSFCWITAGMGLLFMSLLSHVIIYCCLAYTVNGAVLGSDKCTWGPTYWCESFQQADECGTTEHCHKNVWTKKGLVVGLCHAILAGLHGTNMVKLSGGILSGSLSILCI